MLGTIIAGFAGIGKTKTAEKDLKKVIDLESSGYKWIYEDKTIINLKDESRKGIINKKLNPKWSENYIEAIMEARKKYDVIFITLAKDVRDILDEKNIEYILCFPDLNCKEEYIKRYRNRGNREPFIALIEKNFESWIEDLKNAPQKKIIKKKVNI